MHISRLEVCTTCCFVFETETISILKGVPFTRIPQTCPWDSTTVKVMNRVHRMILLTSSPELPKQTAKYLASDSGGIIGRHTIRHAKFLVHTDVRGRVNVCFQIIISLYNPSRRVSKWRYARSHAAECKRMPWHSTSHDALSPMHTQTASRSTVIQSDMLYTAFQRFLPGVAQLTRLVKE